MAKSHAMARCQGYIASVKKGKKKKSTKKTTKSKKKWYVSCAVEKVSDKKTFVRINITAETKKIGFFTKAKDSSKADDLTTTSPEIYQALFAKIDKAIFLRKSLN